MHEFFCAREKGNRLLGYAAICAVTSADTACQSGRAWSGGNNSTQLSNVVLPQLQAATEKLEPLGGRVEIRRYGRTGKSLRPTSVAFRITDRQGHESRVYLIVPRGGTVTVTSGVGFGLTGEPQQAVNVSEKVGIQKRDDLTIKNVKKLILGAIAEYRNDRKRNQRTDNSDDPE
jgi:hypothetical protein